MGTGAQRRLPCRGRAAIDRWADFDARIGIVDERPDVERAFDFTLLGQD